MSRARCQARMGVVVVACAAAGSRTFVLDSRASVPHLHHDPRAIQLASIPGEEVSSPGPLLQCRHKPNVTAWSSYQWAPRCAARDSNPNRQIRSRAPDIILALWG